MKSTGVWGRGPFGIGFVAGLVAGAVASAVMLVLSLAVSGVSLPEAVGAELTLLMPLSWFAALHQVLGVEAKHELFALLLIGQCLVFGFCGALFHRWVAPHRQRLQWYQGGLLALILWLVTGGVLLPLTGAGLFGASLQAGLGSGLFSLAVTGVVFAAVYVLIQRWLIGRLPAGEDASEERPTAAQRSRATDGKAAPGTLSRRTVLTGAAALAVLGLVGTGLWRLLSASGSTATVPLTQVLQHYIPKIVPPPRPNYGIVQPTGSLSAEITPNDQYYIVSKNLFADPTVDASAWRLTIDGQVDHPVTLTYPEVLAQPLQRQYESMLCISNEVGGPYMSSALWEGIPLKDLLQHAGVKRGATKVVFHTVDDYSDSLHLTKALEPTTLLAIQMNGVPLPQEHGFPARLLVPGLYGLKHGKWITHIEVVNYDYQGYWQQRGWTDAAPVHLTARIDTPLDGATLSSSRPASIAGVAFSGEKGISEVDVSTDSGKTWQRATLKQPRSSLTWVLWELAWTPPRGTSIVTARAIDLEGNVQSPMIEPPLPNGSSGYHSISIQAS